MTTSAYLALTLVDELFTTTDLLAAGLRGVLNVGRHAVAYVPHDQVVSLDHPLMAQIEKQPANDNEKDPAVPEPKVAPGMTLELALLTFMHHLTAHDMPFWVRRQAQDWFAYRHEPGAAMRGQRMVEQISQWRPDFLKRFNPSLLALLKPRAGRANLKALHSQIAHGPAAAPETVSIANRPFIEKLLAEKPMPKAKRVKIDPNFDVAI